MIEWAEGRFGKGKNVPMCADLLLDQVTTVGKTVWCEESSMMSSDQWCSMVSSDQWCSVVSEDGSVVTSYEGSSEMSEVSVTMGKTVWGSEANEWSWEGELSMVNGRYNSSSQEWSSEVSMSMTSNEWSGQVSAVSETMRGKEGSVMSSN